MIKYRLAFTMPAETLFALMAKVLPIEDLSVEEIFDKAPAKVTQQSPPQIAKPKAKAKRYRPGGYQKNLMTGVNAIIHKVLADGEIHPMDEIKAAYIAAGYKPNGTGSAMTRQQKWGLVERVEPGRWRLTKEHMQKQRA